jgi:hypothetical protein
MTHSLFITECSTRTIDPSIALENDEVLRALTLGDDQLLLEILDSQF